MRIFCLLKYFTSEMYIIFKIYFVIMLYAYINYTTSVIIRKHIDLLYFIWTLLQIIKMIFSIDSANYIASNFLSISIVNVFKKFYILKWIIIFLLISAILSILYFFLKIPKQFLFYYSHLIVFKLNIFFFEVRKFKIFTQAQEQVTMVLF